MTVLQPHGPAPYTTAVSVTTVMDAYRDRGLGTPVTAAVVTRAGVSETIASRTLGSLKGLGLIDEAGMPTEQFEDLRRVRGNDEYHARLQEWVRGVYADILQYTDPSTDPPSKVAEAFRSYEPGGQRTGMAALLIGLWRYAGLPVAEAVPGTEGRAAPRPKPPKSTKGTKPLSGTGGARGAGKEGSGDLPSGLPPGLVGLLQQIPKEGGSWTQERRDKFLAAFESVLDFTVPIGENESQRADEEDSL